MKKLAKLRYLPNNFEVIDSGDHVICAVSGKKISLEKLNYWNVELQEPYYSYIEAHKKEKEFKIFYEIFFISNDYVSISIDVDF